MGETPSVIADKGGNVQSSNNLFRGSSLAEHLEDSIAYVKRRISQATTAEALDEIASTKSGQATRLRLVREKTAFTTEETPSGAQVTVRVPLSGDVGLLWHRPADTDMTAAAIYATVNDGRFFNDGAYLEFDKTFEEATPEAVKAWAKGVVGAIEAALAAQEPELAAHDDKMARVVAEEVEKRRGVLATATSLREGLSEGI